MRESVEMNVRCVKRCLTVSPPVIHSFVSFSVYVCGTRNTHRIHRESHTHLSCIIAFCSLTAIGTSSSFLEFCMRVCMFVSSSLQSIRYHANKSSLTHCPFVLLLLTGRTEEGGGGQEAREIAEKYKQN